MRRTLAAALLSMGLAACSSPEQATEVVVVVDSDLRIGAELGSIAVSVFDRDQLVGAPLRSNVLAVADALDGGASGPTRYALPLSFVLAPDGQRSARDFRLVVTGRDASGEEVVEQQTIASFRPAYSLRLDVFLGKRCVRQLCREASGERSAESCNVDTGSCEEVKESTLQPTSPGGLGGYVRPDGGEPDAAEDASGPSDGGASDAEARADAEGTDAAPDANADAAVDATVDATAPPEPSPDVHELSSTGTLPLVAASRSGRAAVAWQEEHTSGRDLLRVSLFMPGSGWRTALDLSAATPETEEDNRANIIMDEQGNVTVVWVRVVSLMARRYSVAREAWEDELRVWPDDVAGSPQLSVDPRGNVTACWYTYSWNLNSARLEADTGQWNSLLGFVNDAASRPSGWPTVSADVLGNVFAAWTSDTKRIWTNRYAASTGRWQTPTQVMFTNRPEISASAPVIAGGVDGGALVLWRHDDESDYSTNIGSNRYVPELAAWASSIADDPALLRGDGYAPHIAPDPRGGFITFWSGEARSVRADGTFGPARPVGRAGSVSLTNAQAFDLLVDANGTRIAGWAQNVPGGTDAVYSYAARSATLTESWSDITRLNARLPLESEIENAGFPHLAVGAPGQALMGWAERTQSGTAVRARWVSYPSPAP